MGVSSAARTSYEPARGNRSGDCANCTRRTPGSASLERSVGFSCVVEQPALCCRCGTRCRRACARARLSMADDGRQARCDDQRSEASASGQSGRAERRRNLCRSRARRLLLSGPDRGLACRAAEGSARAAGRGSHRDRGSHCARVQRRGERTKCPARADQAEGEGQGAIAQAPAIVTRCAVHELGFA